MKKAKFGLVLSGGGARGLAHIGFIKVLERENIRPAYLAGTSMGAILGALYASGMDIEKIEMFALESTRTRNMVKMVHLKQPFRGLVDTDKLKQLLMTVIPEHLEFEQLKIPLSICATDLITGRAVALRNGKVLESVLASCALPGVFPSVSIGSMRLVDGGVLNNMPVDQAYQLGAEKVVALDVQARPVRNSVWKDEEIKPRIPLPMPVYFYDMLRSEVIMARTITDHNLQIYPPDIYVDLPIKNDITVLSGYNRAEEVIRVGEVTGEKYLDRIRALLGDPVAV